jgi:radical SAM-linked protein
VPASGPTTAAASRIRVRYSKAGRLRFISAIDLARVWERALRRADLPIAYSEGFSPHPKVSFTDALPLGYASTGEYAELAFSFPIDVDAGTQALNAFFPEGIEVLDAVGVADGAPRFAKWLHASCWDVVYPQATPRLAESVAAARTADTLPVERERKGETRRVDLRPAIHDLRSAADTVRAILHHLEPAVRPTEVHLALCSMLSDMQPPALPEPTLVTRVAQGSPGDDGLEEALSGTVVPPMPPPGPLKGSPS